MDAELRKFKELNLVEFLTNAEGWEIDKASSRNAFVLTHSRGDKILVTRKEGGNFVYCSVYDDSNNGSIIDYLQNTHSLTLGACRKRIRSYLGTDTPKKNKTALQGKFEPIKLDLERIQKFCDELGVIALNSKSSSYMLSRGITFDILHHARFLGRVAEDKRGNVIFRHHNGVETCGYEIKNEGFTGYARGGIKGLWFSHTHREDTEIIIAETAIDALSYAVAHPHKMEYARFFSLAGQPSPLQKMLIEKAIKKCPNLCAITLAFDNDEAGARLDHKFKEMLASSGKLDAVVKSHTPKQRGADWNDVIRPPKLT